MMLFADEFYKHLKPFKQYYPMSPIDAFEPIFRITNRYSYLAKMVGEVVDTPYAIAGLNIEKQKYVEMGTLMLERKLISKWPLDK